MKKSYSFIYVGMGDEGNGSLTQNCKDSFDYL